MMIVTAKVQWKKCILVLAVAVVVILGIILGVGLLGNGPAADTIAVFAPKDGKDDASRVAYLNNYGWEVVPDPLTVEDVLIPEELDEETYGEYLAFQEECGFDLTKYTGKTVTRYTYTILNYPTGEDGIIAGLLVYKGRVVGGDVMSTSMDGFIHSLLMPR